MSLLETDQPTYTAYNLKVQGYWDDLRKRVVELHNRGIKLPFSFEVFRSDYIGDMTMLKTIYEGLWISDDDMQAMRASHAKINAYEASLKESLPKEVQKEIGGPAPDADKIAPPPDTISSTIDDAKKAATEGLKTTGMIAGGLLVVGGLLYLAANKAGKRKEKS